MKLFKMDKINAATPKAFEKKVKEYLQKAVKNAKIERFDYKNECPDWIVLNKNKTMGVECKNYQSFTTIDAAVAQWRKSQPDQHRNFIVLKKYMTIVVIFNLRNETWQVML